MISGGSWGGALEVRTSALFRVKKEEMTDGTKVGRARKTKPGRPLISRSGSEPPMLLN